MRKTWVGFMVSVVMTLFTAGVCYADLSDGYERVVSSYGENASKYIISIDDNGNEVKTVWCMEEDAAVYTETNIRTAPSADVERIATIGTDAKIKVWGYTDTGWCMVWCKDIDGSRYYGYIKGDLLNPADWKDSSVTEPSQDEQSEAETQTEEQSSLGEEGL